MIEQSELCAHCGLPLGGSALSEEGRSFCCNGCRTVYSAIVASGLDAYYREREGSGRRAEQVGGHYEHWDDAGFLARHAEAVKGCDSLRRAELHVEGLHCAACVWLIEKLPSLEPGVVEARVNYADARLEVVWDEQQTQLSRIARRLDALGYVPTATEGAVVRKRQRELERRLLARIGIAGAAFGNVMLLGFALYSGEAYGMGQQDTEFFRWLSLLITIPAVMFSGAPFFRGAWAALRTRTAHMDLPISIGVSAALIGGAVNTLRGAGEIYFDSVTMLVFLLLVGRWLQARQLRRARDAADLMLSLAPSTSRLVSNDGIVEVPTDSVQAGALLEIRSGERIGIDGVVTSGQSAVDASLLSGESRPESVRVGSRVHAGTVNLSSRLLVRASSTGSETRLASIVSEVARAARIKAPFVEFADRISSYFLLAVLCLAGVAVLSTWPLGADVAIERAVALLIVTCPCALGLATPLAGSVALAQAARAGILIKGARHLDALEKPGLFVFDKTGTLTRGELSVVHREGDESALLLALSAEQSSGHPVAQAFREAFAGDEAALIEAEQVEERLGLGLLARVGGQRLVVGSRRLFELEGIDLASFAARERRLVERGLSPVFVGVDGAPRALLGLGDPLREEARACLQQLNAAGHRLALLSGDRKEVAQAVVQELGVPFHIVLAEQSPEQKLAFIKAQQAQGPVFMVGDGVNDAAALSASSVGIAVAGGAEASLAAADIFTTRSGLEPLNDLLEGARGMMRLVRSNLMFSIAYNAVAAGLALLGLIHPLVAAVLMPLSSLTVVFNTLRTRCFTPRAAALRASSAMAEPRTNRKGKSREHNVSTDSSRCGDGGAGRRGVLVDGALGSARRYRNAVVSHAVRRRTQADRAALSRARV